MQPVPSTVAPALTAGGRIERSEIDAVLAVDAFDAVALLHPDWITLYRLARPDAAFVIYVDSTRKSVIEDLRTVPRASIGRIEYAVGSRLTELTGVAADSTTQAIVVLTATPTSTVAADSMPGWLRMGITVYPLAMTRGGESDWERAMLADGWTRVSGIPQAPKFWMIAARVVAHHVFLEFLVGNEWGGRVERYSNSNTQLNVHYSNRMAGAMVGFEYAGVRAGWARIAMASQHDWLIGACECKGSPSFDKLKPAGNVFEVGATRSVWKSIVIDAALQRHQFERMLIAVPNLYLPTSLWDANRTLFTIGVGTRLGH